MQYQALSYLRIAALCKVQFLLPIMLLFYQHNGLDSATLFLFQGIFSILALIFEIPCGYIADLIGKKNILLFSFFLLIVRTFLWINFEGYAVVLIGGILFSLSSSFYSGIADSYVYEYLQQYRLEKAMVNKNGRQEFYLNLGIGVSAFLGAYIYKLWGINGVLMAELLLNFIGFSYLLKLPNLNNALSATKTFNIIKPIKECFFQNKHLLNTLIFISILFGTSIFMALAFQPILKAIEAPIIIFGLLYFTNYAVRAICSLLSHKLKKQLSLPRLSKLCALFFIMALVLMILGLQYIAFLGYIGLMLACLAIGLQVSSVVIFNGLMHQKIASNQGRASVSSFINATGRFVSGLNFILMHSLLKQTSLTAILIIYLGIFSLFAFWGIQKTKEI